MRITKMQGLGNDFIITEAFDGEYSEAAEVLCKRRVSVGADGLIIREPSDTADASMRIFNADGTEAEMCGNGIRCFARYLYDNGYVKHVNMSIETKAGIMRPEIILENGAVKGVKVNMGKGLYGARDVPVNAEDALNFRIETEKGSFDASAMRMGVPHTVVFVEDLDAADIYGWGSAIEGHSIFPQRTNVNFAQADGQGRIYMRTYERGAGPTMACGTGSTAAALLAFKKGITGRKTEVVLEAGSLFIEIDDDGTAYMTGPADYVFKGETFWKYK